MDSQNLVTIIINTNKRNSPYDEYDMIQNKKCAAYGDKKYVIDKIPLGALVFLYSNECGIIAVGIASGQVQQKARNGVDNNEHSMELINFHQLEHPISHKMLSVIYGKKVPVSRTAQFFSCDLGAKIMELIYAQPRLSITA